MNIQHIENCIAEIPLRYMTNLTNKMRDNTFIDKEMFVANITTHWQVWREVIRKTMKYDFRTD